jgi:hypothetical protein
LDDMDPKKVFKILFGSYDVIDLFEVWNVFVVSFSRGYLGQPFATCWVRFNTEEELRTILTSVYCPLSRRLNEINIKKNDL